MNKLSKLQYFYYRFVFSNRFFRKVKALIDIVIFMVFKPKGVSVWTGARHLDYTFEEGGGYPDGLYITLEGELGVMKRGASVIGWIGSSKFVYDEKKLHEEKPMGFTATSLLFALVLSASVALAWNGSGTYEDPYEINTASDVADLVSAVNGGASQSGVYFLQTADIDLSTFGNFTPIGSASAPFKGSYDGDGYILSNLTITASVSGATTNAFGFFGYVEEATIENVNVQGKVGVAADYNASACVGVGGVIGITVKGLFASLHNYCDIDVKISDSPTGQASTQNIKYGVGGVVGLNAWATNNGTTHIGCENYGNICVDGINGVCAVGGCFSVNIPDSGTSTTFSGWNNYGNIITKGKGENGMDSASIVSGVGAVHWGIATISQSRNPFFTGCSNFGNILSSNCVRTSGVATLATTGYGNNATRTNYCTNYGDIAFVSDTTSGARCFIGGVLVGGSVYQDSTVRFCVNFGKITAYGDGKTYPQIGGVFSCRNGGQAAYGYSYSNKNFGDIDVNLPNVSSVIVGGVGANYIGGLLQNSENHGNIKANTNGSVLIGGVASMSSQGQKRTVNYNCANYGSIIASGNANTNYSPCVGGVFASTRGVGSDTRSVIVSNCYSLGAAKLNLNADNCYGAIYGVANTYGNYAVSIKNCYAIVGEGQNLIGAVDASNGNVSLENCVGIKSGREGGIAYSVVGSNNWSQVGTTLVSYDDCYTNPYQCYGNMGSGIFTPADKTTNYFDLILPINTQLYPTPSAEDKKNHSYTKAQGYKRYVKTNRL